MKKIIAILLLFAILPFANAKICDSDAILSVEYNYNHVTQKLTLVFEQSNDINAFLIISTDEPDIVVSEEITGKSPVEKEYVLITGNYSLTISDRSNETYKTQQSCELELIPVVESMPNCEALNGKICSDTEVCSNMVIASDTDFCCVGQCKKRITQSDSKDVIINPIFGFIILLIMVAVIAAIVVFAKKFVGSKQIEYEEPEKKQKFMSEDEGDEPKYV